MPSPEELAHQQRLLAKYRRNLATLEEQAAKYGNAVPLHLVNDLHDTREAIERVEADIQAGRPSRRTGAVAEPDRNRQVMISQVRRTWIDGVLKESLWNDALLTLRLAERPDAVARPYGLRLRGRGGDEPLPTGTTIEDVYDAQQGALLILGQPGSGKTTLLLELARTLLDRADADPTHPIPVVFNLATWQEKQTLAQWLVEQLNREYLVPRKIGQAWVDRGALLPLLDGLDEVAEARRATCVVAINTYRSEHEAAWATSIVVSCRSHEYEKLPLLQLHAAVIVQTLTEQEIDTFLRNGGEALIGLQAIVQHDPTLYELLETPLLLATTTLAFRGRDATALLEVGDAVVRRREIFAAYVDRQLQPPPIGKGIDPRYDRDRVLRWLAELARRMFDRNQSMYWIEFMRPDWLSTYAMQRMPMFAVGLFGGLVGGLVGGPLLGIVLGLLLALASERDALGSVDFIRWDLRSLKSRSYWATRVSKGLTLGAAVGLSIALAFSPVLGLIVVLIGGIFYGLSGVINWSFADLRAIGERSMIGATKAGRKGECNASSGRYPPGGRRVADAVRRLLPE